MSFNEVELMKTIRVTVRGISPLLQHRFSEEAEDSVNNPSARKMLVKRGNPREEAEKVVYRNGEGFYFPSTWLSRSLSNAGTNFKMRGTRKSLRFVLPSAVVVSEVQIPLLNGDTKARAKDFEVDSRPVTIPSTKGRVMRHRPRFDAWSARFSLEVDDDILPVETVHEVFADAGRKVGIGDYRPEKGGPFGRFEVIEWREQ